MKALRLLIFLALTGFFLLPVQGAGIIASVSKSQQSVAAGEDAIFTISIKNTQIRDDIFRLKPDDFSITPFSDAVGSVSFDPSGSVSIPANQKKDVIAKVRFLDTALSDRNYITKVKISSLNNPDVSTMVGLSAYVISPRELINIDAGIPSIIVPGREEIIPVTLTNNGNVDLNDLDIFYTSNIFNLEDKVSIDALQKKSTELNLKLESIINPGEYTLTIRLFDDGKLKGSRNFKINVGENPDLKEVEEVKTSFLKSVVEITRENEGNTQVSKTVRYPVGFVKGLFTKTSPRAELKNDDSGRYYEWKFNIPPGDIYRIEVETNYRLVFFLIAGVLILVGALYYIRRRNLKVKKTVFQIRRDKESGVSEFKILLHVINRTNREMYNVKVIDLIPRFIKSETDFGTLKPAKIEEGSRGMRLVWNIEKVDPGDERIISYKLKSKVSLVGKVTLPSTIVQYYGRKKQIINVKSNRLVFRW